MSEPRSCEDKAASASVCAAAGQAYDTVGYAGRCKEAVIQTIADGPQRDELIRQIDAIFCG